MTVLPGIQTLSSGWKIRRSSLLTYSFSEVFTEETGTVPFEAQWLEPFLDYQNQKQFSISSWCSVASSSSSELFFVIVMLSYTDYKNSDNTTLRISNTRLNLVTL